MTIQISEETKDYIVARHEAANDEVNSVAGSVPTSVDGGIGTENVLTILATIVSTTRDIGNINTVIAAIVDHVGTGLEQTDAEVADGFEQATRLHIEPIKAG